MSENQQDQPSGTNIQKLSAPHITSRYAAIGLVIAGIIGLFAYAGGWLAPHILTPKRFIERFEHVNGVSPGFRRNHAKGLCFSGWFDSNGQGMALSKAVLFRTGRVPITAAESERKRI